MLTLIAELFLILLMIASSAVFAAYEMSLASIAASRLHVLAGRKVRGAPEALFMKNNMEASLAVIQLGLTLVGAIAAAAGGLSAADILSPLLIDHWHVLRIVADVLALVLVVVPLSAVTIVFGELVPKMVALQNRERVCLTLSPAMSRLSQGLLPIVKLLETIVKRLVAFISRRMGTRSPDESQGFHELHAAVAMARTARLIGAHQEKIVLSAAQLSSRPVREIVIPVQDISTINLSSTLSEALIRAHMDMHTRFPVVEKDDDPQTVVGYINFKDIMSALKLNPGDPSVRGIVRPVKRIDSDTSISHALEQMMHEKIHIAMVTGKNGRVIGMISMEDIIEELVGEIEDEFDRLPAHVHPFAGGWIMGGGVPLTVLARETGSAFTGDKDAGRLADWCTRNGIVNGSGGEWVEADGIRVVARKFRRRLVSEAAVSVATPAGD